MSKTSLSQLKRQQLDRRFDELAEEYKATNEQLGRALSDADKVKLQRSREHLEIEMERVEEDRNALESTPSDPPFPLESRSKTVAIPTPPDRDVLEVYSHWTDERLLSSIQENAGSPDQNFGKMVQVLCWRLREKQEAKMRRLEQLQAQRRNLQQSARFVPQGLRDSIRDVSRDVSRLENLAAQAKRYCASEDTNPQD